MFTIPTIESKTRKISENTAQIIMNFFRFFVHLYLYNILSYQGECCIKTENLSKYELSSCCTVDLKLNSEINVTRGERNKSLEIIFNSSKQRVNRESESELGTNSEGTKK